MPEQSLFLFGPRATGKSTWLRHLLPEALVVDLLQPNVYREMSARPERLRELVLGSPRRETVVVDETSEPESPTHDGIVRCISGARVQALRSISSSMVRGASGRLRSRTRPGCALRICMRYKALLVITRNASRCYCIAAQSACASMASGVSPARSFCTRHTLIRVCLWNCEVTGLTRGRPPCKVRVLIPIRSFEEAPPCKSRLFPMSCILPRYGDGLNRVVPQ